MVDATTDTKPILLACPWGLGNRLRAITAAVHRIRAAGLGGALTATFCEDEPRLII